LYASSVIFNAAFLFKEIDYFELVNNIILEHVLVQCRCFTNLHQVLKRCYNVAYSKVAVLPFAAADENISHGADPLQYTLL
jgi:hypothetical protein